MWRWRGEGGLGDVGLYGGCYLHVIDWFDTTLHAALYGLRKAVGWPAVSKWNPIPKLWNHCKSVLTLLRGAF